MIIKTEANILSKKTSSYTGKDGTTRNTYHLNYSQQNDEIVGTLSVREDIFNMCEKGKHYELVGEYRTSSNGNFISWQAVKPVNEGGKI